ncbi:MAG: bifunctional homocysteine S-methyltransferase/methylenetetrahydrofolate reductase [Bdellovibrionales bacterium]|nr:bifunctional homocysteine S-methyltransferase/methylenetetrahydrofolate reductase [Oligoflexia bacterium]
MQKFEDLFRHAYAVFDGGVATELYERGFYINRPFEELNVSHGRDVAGVHESYVDAGAMMVTTNSFSLTSPQLDKFDIKARQSELLQASIRIAAQAVKSKGGEAKVGLTLGPMAVLIEPLGPTSREEVRQEYENLTRFAMEAPLYDFYILETFSNLDELDAAIDGIRRIDIQRPILASITAMSSETHLLQNFASRIGGRVDVQALGINCSEGPHDLLQSLKILKPLTSKPIVIQPNAGIPRSINGRYFYMTSPDYMAKFAKRFIEAGAYGVGGCCGTGPDHIRAIAQSLKMMEVKVIREDDSKSVRIGGGIEITERLNIGHRSLDVRSKSRISQKLKAKQKIITIEFTSPRGTDLTKFTQSLQMVKNANVDLINVPDGARASTRVSSLHLAAFVNRQDLGVKVIPHLTTRDRNLIALQADLLGASINQVHDVLLITGDPPKLGNSRDATAVYDIDSIGLTYLVEQLNRGLTIQGDALGSQTEFAIGVASNPTAINLELELKRWQYKVESGADFAITQPIYERETFLRWKDKTGANYRPHVIGIWPFVSYKNAEFMAHEVPGVYVPHWALEKMSRVQDDPVASVKAGVEIAATIMKDLWSECEGFAISAPLGRAEVALEVLKCLE